MEYGGLFKGTSGCYLSALSIDDSALPFIWNSCATYPRCSAEVPKTWGYCKLIPHKFDVFKRQVRFLGQMVSEQRYTMDPAEIAPVQAL